MKYIKGIFLAIVAVALAATGCQDADPGLGKMLDKSEIDFSVTQDFAVHPGGNTVILKNNTPGTVSIWDYGTGRSNKVEDRIQFAFKGDYVIKFSALTAGGVVEMDPVTITVTEDDLTLVDDPMWDALSGGVGNEKSWVLDIDAKFFDGPLYFYGTNNGWEGACMVPGGDCWNWNPEYAGNTWLMEAGDYGTMTFNLIGGGFVSVDHKKLPARGTENGTYFLDTNTKTLTLTDVTPLHDSGRDGCVAQWGNIRLLSLTEDAMQFAVLRTSCEGPCLLVYNYISKEYSDNWVPEEQPDPNFDHGDQADLLAVTPTKTWKFDLQVPYNWADLEGGFLNPWNSRADIMATGWAPYGDADVANIDDASISFTNDGTVVVKQDDGSTQSGTFTVDEPSNMITFTGVTPSWPIAGWVTAGTTDDNKWKIVKLERNVLTDAVEGIWFGKRDPVKSEYMVFHFVLR
jgi:hypothetical protein